MAVPRPSGSPGVAVVAGVVVPATVVGSSGWSVVDVVSSVVVVVVSSTVVEVVVDVGSTATVAAGGSAGRRLRHHAGGGSGDAGQGQHGGAGQQADLERAGTRGHRYELLRLVGDDGSSDGVDQSLFALQLLRPRRGCQGGNDLVDRARVVVGRRGHLAASIASARQPLHQHPRGPAHHREVAAGRDAPAPAPTPHSVPSLGPPGRHPCRPRCAAAPCRPDPAASAERGRGHGRGRQYLELIARDLQLERRRSRSSGRRPRRRSSSSKRRRAIVNSHRRKSSGPPEKVARFRATSSHVWAARSSAAPGSRPRRYRSTAGW